MVFPPSLDFMLAFLACLKAGVIAVPVFPPNPARKDTLLMFSRITESSGAKFALTSQEYNHLKKLAGVKDVFTKFMTTRQQPNAAAIWPEQLEWIITDNSNNSKGTSPSSLATPKKSDVAFLQYTSGSTSEPKGVMITHGNLGHNLTIITNELQAKDDTVVVSWLPQYHDMGLIGSYLGVLYCGGSGYYISPLTFLQRPMIWMEAISNHQATHLQAPNFAFKLVARKFDASQYTKSTLQLASVRHVINAAEPVDEDSMETFYKAFTPFGFPRVIYPTYGLAEHTVFVCSGGTQRLSVNKQELEVNGKVVLVAAETSNNINKDDDTVSRMIGCGYPERQGVDVRIVETEHRKQVGDDVVGEIWVHSESKAAGYFGKEKESKEDFHATLAADGSGSEYLRTGDLGFLHKGELFICGRLKDLIIVGGRNYYPQDIEATAEAAGNDLVRLGCSAAFTIDPTHQGGEEVALVMELKEVPSSQSEIDKVCMSLANSIKGAINAEQSLGIATIVFLKPRTVPKTSSGKIARAWCRKGFLGGTLSIVYKKAFKNMASLEIEGNGTPGASNGQDQGHQQVSLTKDKIEELRAMDKKDIVAKLVVDVNKMGGSLDPSSGTNNDSPIVTFLDSMTISQFKGLLESHYATKLSDEYLFRETTTLNKLAEVVKLGYAPDDDGGSGDGPARVPEGVGTQGKADGIAGMLGCPPGVVCCVIS